MSLVALCCGVVLGLLDLPLHTSQQFIDGADVRVGQFKALSAVWAGPPASPPVLTSSGWLTSNPHKQD